MDTQPSRESFQPLDQASGRLNNQQPTTGDEYTPTWAGRLIRAMNTNRQWICNIATRCTSDSIEKSVECLQAFQLTPDSSCFAPVYTKLFIRGMSYSVSYVLCEFLSRKVINSTAFVLDKFVPVYRRAP